MKIQTQNQKAVELTSEEIEAILVDYLRREGIMEDGDEVTIENVPDVVFVQLLGKVQVLVQSTPKLESLTTSTETMKPKDDTTPIAVDHTGGTTNSSNILSKFVGVIENLGRDTVFADPIEDLPTPIVTRDLFSYPSKHTTQQEGITKDFWGDGEDQIVTKKPITENLFA